MSEELTKNLQEKIDLRQEAVDKLDAKIESVDEQIEVMTKAKARYLVDRDKKQETLDRLRALLDGLGPTAAKIAKLRARQTAILKQFGSWMPSDGEEGKAQNQPEYIANKELIEQLLVSSSEAGLTKSANKIYYGKG